LSDEFDTRVKVEFGRRKGRIVVEFASVDDLERIVAMMAPTVVSEANGRGLGPTVLASDDPEPEDAAPEDATVDSYDAGDSSGLPVAEAPAPATPAADAPAESTPAPEFLHTEPAPVDEAQPVDEPVVIYDSGEVSDVSDVDVTGDAQGDQGEQPHHHDGEERDQWAADSEHSHDSSYAGE
jgi:hypothetical protein